METNENSLIEMVRKVLERNKVQGSITASQELELYRFSNLLANLDKEALQESLISLMLTLIQLQNNSKLLSAQLLDAKSENDTGTFLTDMRKRLEMEE